MPKQLMPASAEPAINNRQWQTAFNEALVSCELCPRLKQWRQDVAKRRVHVAKRHMDELYWGKPVPTFGDPNGRVLIVGLAPAAHGANRTGRLFTGDRSGDWLYRAMHKAGLANQATSISADDGLTLLDSMITCVCHCAPPENKLLPDEVLNCRPYLHQEFTQYQQLRVVIALGKIAFDNVLIAIKELGYDIPKPKPTFSHGVDIDLIHPATGKTLNIIGSYHPSQQNTFTGKLTEPMFDSIFRIATGYLQ